MGKSYFRQNCQTRAFWEMPVYASVPEWPLGMVFQVEGTIRAKAWGQSSLSEGQQEELCGLNEGLVKEPGLQRHTNQFTESPGKDRDYLTCMCGCHARNVDRGQMREHLCPERTTWRLQKVQVKARRVGKEAAVTVQVPGWQQRSIEKCFPSRQILMVELTGFAEDGLWNVWEKKNQRKTWSTQRLFL